MSHSIADRIPPHVPASLVHDFDLYNVEVADGDYHAALKRLHDRRARHLLDAAQRGHWVARAARTSTRSSRTRALLVAQAGGAAPPQPARFRCRRSPRPARAGQVPLAVLAGAVAQSRVAAGRGARALAIELIEGFHAGANASSSATSRSTCRSASSCAWSTCRRTDREKLLHWADQQVRPTSEEEREQSFRNLFAYAAQKVAERKANPGSDLISQLTKAQVDGTAHHRRAADADDLPAADRRARHGGLGDGLRGAHSWRPARRTGRS